MAYNVLLPIRLISAGDMSANITSVAVNIQNQDNLSIQAVFTGTPTGTFAVQVSLDHKQENNGGPAPVVTNPGTWSTLSSAPAAPAGSAGNSYIDITQISAPYVRIVYTHSSGSGVLDLYLAAKGI